MTGFRLKIDINYYAPERFWCFAEMKKRRPTKRRARRAFVVALVSLVILTAVATGIYFFLTREKKYKVQDVSGQTLSLTVEEMREVLDTGRFYSGISINGVDMAGKTKEDAQALFAGNPDLDKPSVSVMLSAQNNVYPVDANQIGLSSNINTVIDEAFSIGKTSTLTDEGEALADRYNTMTNLILSPKSFTTAYTADPLKTSLAVHTILDPLETEMKNAKAVSFDLDMLAFVYEEAQVGVTYQSEKAAEDICAAIASGDYNPVITVDYDMVQPDVTSEILRSKIGYITETTTETTGDENRNTNIRLVCETINGLLLQPGESFDYNEYVGQRTAEKGYKEAVGIFEGATRLELGGGICQVSGTMFHSVMKADLEVVERHPHSWPSSYVQQGTDATVTWGGQNFIFRNNSEYPVAIVAYYWEQTVTVALYGRPLEENVTIQIEGNVISETPPPPPEYVADPLLPAGTIAPKNVRDPHNQITAECYKVFYRDGVEFKRELVTTSYYPAISAKIGVGVLAPDGVTLYPLDPKTGVVTIPPTPTPDPNAPTPDPNAPTPDPNAPTPDPSTPTSDPSTPTTDPNATPVPAESEP